MLNISKTTSLSNDEALNKIKVFFGDKGLQLETEEEESNCLAFTGGGGYVRATVCPEKKGNRVDLVTQEWEYQVKEFMTHL